ncbi:hypothetical protein [Alkaliphilus transvaalensis]|uniref:hypothetical protein n=1 Tax=Alkaliphilus transvaalensis TaxID=114628 RepID=UPI000478BD38|nr:hypothetical protein [Alkaliphilus transvaalensis]
MDKVEKTLDMGGIPTWEFVQYFEELGCKQEGEDTFLDKNWRVNLVESEEMLGSIKMTRVKITFIGDEKIIDHVITNFRKMFMRAGG